MSTRKRPAPFDPSPPHDSPKRARNSIEPQSQAHSHDSTNGNTRQRSRSPHARQGDRRDDTGARDRERRGEGGRGADRRDMRGGGGVAGRDERNGGRAGTNGARRESPRRDRDRERSRSPRREAAGRGGAAGGGAAGRGGRTSTTTSQRDRDDHRPSSFTPSGKANGTTAPPTKGGKKAAVKGEVVELDMDVDDDPDAALQRQMEKTMGFGKFKTTKNTKVPGNDKLYGVRKEKVMVARQYMNRVGGFNRPLSPSHE